MLRDACTDACAATYPGYTGGGCDRADGTIDQGCFQSEMNGYNQCVSACASTSSGQALPTTISDVTLPTLPTWYKVLGAIGGILGAYHGYKRHNGSIGWAIGWSLLGSAFAPIAIPVAFAQGIGKPMK